MRVVCAGHVNWDVTLRIDHLPEPDGEARIHSQAQSGGGSAANVAASFVGLDVRAGLLGSVGDDEYGLLARRDLDRVGVGLDGLRTVAGTTAVKYLLVDDAGEVSVLGTNGANEAVAPADVDPAYVQGAAHVHLTSQRPDTAAHIARLASEADVPVSFDPGRRAGARDYSETLAHADLLFVNEREARQLGEIPPACTVITKRGAAGAAVRLSDGREVTHPGFGLPSVDSTGAGDAFAAGYLAAAFRGHPPERALAVGNACGALTAAGEGARVALSWAAIERVHEQA
jgi:ribokinase